MTGKLCLQINVKNKTTTPPPKFKYKQTQREIHTKTGRRQSLASFRGNKTDLPSQPAEGTYYVLSVMLHLSSLWFWANNYLWFKSVAASPTPENSETKESKAMTLRSDAELAQKCWGLTARHPRHSQLLLLWLIIFFLKETNFAIACLTLSCLCHQNN